MTAYNGQAYSASLLVDTSVLAAVAVGPGLTTMFSGSSTFPPGTYTAQLSAAQASAGSLAWQATWSCCSRSQVAGSEQVVTSFVGPAPPVEVFGDGYCEFAE
ncbi:MAG: hypothetical protein WB783_10145 [Arenicellales bacterium]